MAKRRLSCMLGLVFILILGGMVKTALTAKAAYEVNLMMGYTFDYKFNNQTFTYEIITLDGVKEQGTVKVKQIKAGEIIRGEVRIPSTVTFLDATYRVTEIGDLAFHGQDFMTGIYLPETLTTIGEEAFKDCSSLTSIDIPSSVTKIGAGAFSSCSMLTQISLPSGIKEIERSTFSENMSLTKINIPEGVTSIGNYAFAYCNKLSEINFPSSVEKIGIYAFDGCTSLVNLTIPDNLKSVGIDAFNNSGLQDVVLPETVTITYEGITFEYKYYGYNFIYQVLSDPKDSTLGTVVCRGGYSKYDTAGVVHIPKTVKNGQKEYVVTRIGNHAFDGSTRMTNITIPDTITQIGDYAFKGCASLQSITIPKAVTIIGDAAFANCYRLTKFTIPEGITRISDRMLESCNSLTNVNIPGKVKVIGKRAFFGCPFSQILIPNGVTQIDQEAFGACWNINNVVIPDSVTEIGVDAFSSCSGMTNIKLSKNLKAIEHGLFQDSTSLKSISIPYGVTVIGNASFKRCTSLETISIPKSVVQINDYAFMYCSKVKSILLPEKLTKIGPSAFAEFNKVFTISKNSYAAIYLKGKAYPYTYISDVNSSKILLEDVVIKQNNIVKNPGDHFVVSVVYYPHNTTANKNIVWASSNSKIAKVDSKGNVTAVSSGKVTISATVGTKKATRVIYINPKAPSTITAVSASYNSIKITWSKIDNATGYRLYRAKAKTGQYALIADTQEVTYLHTNLSNYNTYYYKVIAYKQYSEKEIISKDSSIASAYPILAKPSYIKAYPYESKRIRINGGKSSGAGGYVVYRATSYNGTFEFIGESNYPMIDDTKVVPGKTYYYKMKAYNDMLGTKVFSDSTKVVSAKANP